MTIRRLGPEGRFRLSAIIVLAVFLTSASMLSAQTVADTSTDLKFHKFQPSVPPEYMVPQASQFQSATEISANAKQQMQMLQAEKDARTPAQQKIDSNVLYTIRMLQGQPAALGVPYLYTGVDLDDHNNLVLDMTAVVSPDLLKKLTATGAQVLSSYPGMRSVRAIVPPGQVENIAAFPEVIFISPKQEARTQGSRYNLGNNFMTRAARVKANLAVMLQATVRTGQGSVTTEGDLTHRAFDARGTFGVNGAGLKIGVLSDGVTNLALSQATGDLPPTCGTPPCVTVLPGQTGSGDEGTAMMEIIHDMAPGASLYFATAFNGITSFAQNIRDLRAAGCDIIVDDVFYFVESAFQDGQAASIVSNTNGGVVIQAVNDVVADGALYFSSAGNEGSLDAVNSGTYEADFNPVPATAPLPTGNVHSFAGTPFNPSPFPGAATVLHWADPLGASSNDYDLYALDPTAATVVAASTNVQNGTQDPFEEVQTFNLGTRFVVFQKPGAANRFFHLESLEGTLQVATSGETHGHSAASGAYTVAATPAVGPFPNPFNAANLTEFFSSDGPRHIFFHGDGTAITPGNFSSSGGTVLNKPDITAADGVSVTGVGGFPSPFFGTSAAAPSAAAVAALVKSANPALTQAQIRAALTSTAIDIMAPGFDRDSGSGIVMAYEAVKSLGVPGTANPEISSVTVSENPGNGNGVLEIGEGGKIVIQLKNSSGVQDATGVSAVLTSSTPGVTITQPNSTTFPDLPIGTSSFTNLSPLTFTIGNDAPCGASLQFTLTVTFNGGTSRSLDFSVPMGQLALTNTLGTTPFPALPGLHGATGTQTDRVLRNGIASTCGTPKAFPGTITVGSRTFDSYTFTACRSTCLNPQLSSPAAISMFEVAYSPSFNPANISANYLADAGASGASQKCSFSTAPGTTYAIVISDVGGASAGQSYTLQLPACAFNCNNNHVPNALVHDVTVPAATLGGSADASIDNGSFDPDGDTITMTQTPAGPYPKGTTTVMLTVVDPQGATAQATAVVTVIDPAGGTAPTTTGLNASTQSPTLGGAITLTATVNKGAGSTTPGGTVNFKQGTAVLGSATLDNTATATLQTTSLTPGPHNITALYFGDATYAGSTSAATVVTVITPTTTSLNGNPANPGIGGTVTLIAAINKAPGLATPTGTVTFNEGTTTLGSGTVNAAATATMQISTLASGQHSITAAYSGDSLYLPSTSAAFVVTVGTTPPDFTVNIPATSKTVPAGQSAQYTFTITPQGGFSATVNFSCSGLPQGASCGFNPPTVTVNGSPASTTLTITTTARTVTTASAGHGLGALAATGAGCFAFGLVLVGGFSSRKRRLQLMCMLLLGMTMIVSMTACGGGSHQQQQQFMTGTPAGTYTVTVAATGASVTKNSTITLVVQ